MRILQIATNYDPKRLGGAERMVDHLTRHLVKNGHDVGVLTCEEAGDAADYKIYRVPKPIDIAERLGTSILSIPSMWNVAWQPRLEKIMTGYDLIHFHNTHSYAITHYGVRAAKRLEKKIVWTPHDYWFACPRQTLMRNEREECNQAICDAGCLGKGMRGRWLASRHRAANALKDADMVLPPSEYVAGKIRAFGVPAERVRTIYNGVEIPKSPPVFNHGKSILYVGRLDVWKGTRVLADAFIALSKIEPDAELAVVGEGPEREFLEAKVSQSRARFHGRVSQDALDGFYAAASVVVVPSIWPEPFGLAAVEAMARARPVVAARSGALPEIIEDGRSGVIVTPNDPKALAEAVLKILNDGKMGKSFGERGRVLAESKFSIEGYGKNVEAAYESVAR